MKAIFALLTLGFGVLFLDIKDISTDPIGYVGITTNAGLPVLTSRAAGIHWGDWKMDHCTGPGKRQYSSVLWDIPWGKSWEEACNAMPVDIAGQHFDRPTRCVNTTLNMWGEVDVNDSTCSIYWETPFKADECVNFGYRQFSSQIIVPGNLSWEEACQTTGATILGQEFAAPTRCEKPAAGTFGMWGEFDVKDDSCLPKWNPFEARQCVSFGYRQFSSQIIVPEGLSWEVACQTTGATILGQEFSSPTRCEKPAAGIAGMWGEFDVKDDSCIPKWNPFEARQCTDFGVRQYSSQIIVPGDLSWEVACQTTGAMILGQEFSSPTRCEKPAAGIAGMWGEFDVKNDDSCFPKWNPFKADQCVSFVKRQFSSQLIVPEGLSWEVACQTTGATILGQEFSSPTRCEKPALGVVGMWGEFDVTDYSCVIGYLLTQMSWDKLVGAAIALVIAVGLFLLGARFFPRKKPDPEHKVDD